MNGKRIGAALIGLVLIFILLSLTNQGGLLEFSFSASGYNIHAGPIISLVGLKGLITVIVIALYFIIFEAIKGAIIGKLDRRIDPILRMFHAETAKSTMQNRFACAINAQLNPNHNLDVMLLSRKVELN